MVRLRDYPSFPKTVRYRGKVYSTGTGSGLAFPSKAKANAYIAKSKALDKKYHKKGINFFTVVKEYKDGKKKFAVIYWRGVYSKAVIAKRRKELSKK